MENTKQKFVDLAYSKFGIKANESINFEQAFEILDEIEQLTIPAVVNSSKFTCPDCGNRGWLYDKEGARTGICPCHY